jgi:hypothetical protein
MTPSSSPQTLLIAAHQPIQASALAELLQALRPEARITSLAERGTETERVEPDVALVVEPPGDAFGTISARVREVHAQLPIMVIAPCFDEEAIDAVAKLGHATILPSPLEPATLLRALKALQRKVRFPGRCNAVDTGELLRLHAAASSNGVLHLAEPTRSGAIHLEDGQPVHAHCGGQRGAEAVREMLGWTEAKATWIHGRSATTRTIVGRIEGLLERELSDDRANYEIVEEAPREVLHRLEHLASIEDILGAYLLRNTEVVAGRNDSSLDEVVIGRALTQLARVFHDMEDQQGDLAGSEIQATVGDHRLVVDRIGPARLGFQIGVVVRQATPVCKSLRRLLRQIDRNFRKSLVARQREAEAAKGGGDKGNKNESLHQVA